MHPVSAVRNTDILSIKSTDLVRGDTHRHDVHKINIEFTQLLILVLQLIE